MNNVILLGRLTAAPELKTTPQGTSVVAFCVAVDRAYKSKDGERQTDFINCVAWRNTAEHITRNFTKGDPISIQGEIQSRKYTDKDGNKRVAVEVQAFQARFVPKNSGNNAPTETYDYTELDNDDDLPF